MARLTAAARHRLPASSFALPGGRYPIEDPNHARAALTDVSRVGSPAQKAEVREEVHEKYPSIGKSNDPRHHALTIASATHLHNAGHITAMQKAHIHAKAKANLARLRGKASEPMAFGSLAPRPDNDGDAY